MERFQVTCHLMMVVLLAVLVAMTTQRKVGDSYQCTPQGHYANCTCSFDAKMNGTELNCKGLDITFFPTQFTIPDDLKNKEIVGLELGMNKISHLESGSLTNYPHLRYLILDQNQIDFIADDVFTGSAELDILDLSNNPELKKIPKLDVALQRLNLANTGLDAVEQPLDLSGLPGVLYDLLLDENNLEQWPVEFPSGLATVSLKHNLLKTIDDTGDDFRRLGELYLDYNQIQKLDSSVSSLPDGLLTLSMNYNPIESIDNDYFHNLDAIKMFSVAHTAIDDISKIAFQGASPRYTEDESVELSFENNGNLKRVFKETFDPFLYTETKYQTLTIKLSGCALDCSCEMIWIPDLIANFSKMGLSPAQVIFEGECILPAELSGRSLSSLKHGDIHCNRNPDDDDNSDDSAKNAAIVLGVILALVCTACIGYFLYDRFYKKTYMTI